MTPGELLKALADLTESAAWVAKLESEGRIHRCGGCAKWMTKSCPQERLGNDGRSRGPSCKAIACPEFTAAPGVGVVDHQVKR